MLPFPSNSVDEVFVTNPFVETMRQAGRSAIDEFKLNYFREVARVLKTDGRVI
ncbi:MAG: hypothetical protein IT322_14750 [Anaerolineae bacterium]|nr:hypothetical protein [Anaerolineae bacterium]